MARSQPPRAPKFGAWLRLQRGDRSLEQIAIKIRPLVKAAGFKIDQSLIYRFEQGRVPSWPMLGAFGRVYDIPLTDLIAKLISEIEFPGARELLCQSDPVESSSHDSQGSRTDGASVPSDSLTERVWLELGQAAYAFKSLAVECEEWSNRLIDLAAEAGREIVGGQVTDPRGDTPVRTRHRGTTHRRPAQYTVKKRA